jgi:hypothetical protein
MQETRVSPKGPGGKGHERMAVGYTRVSTQEQAREGASLQAQRERIEGHCKAQGLDLLGVQTDEGISGRKTVNRPGLEQALTEVCRIKGTLVVYRLVHLMAAPASALSGIAVLPAHFEHSFLTFGLRICQHRRTVGKCLCRDQSVPGIVVAENLLGPLPIAGHFKSPATRPRTLRVKTREVTPYRRKTNMPAPRGQFVKAIALDTLHDC